MKPRNFSPGSRLFHAGKSILRAAIAIPTLAFPEFHLRAAIGQDMPLSKCIPSTIYSVPNTMYHTRILTMLMWPLEPGFGRKTAKSSKITFVWEAIHVSSRPSRLTLGVMVVSANPWVACWTLGPKPLDPPWTHPGTPWTPPRHPWTPWTPVHPPPHPSFF